jgi:hypothetical protein
MRLTHCLWGAPPWRPHSLFAGLSFGRIAYTGKLGVGANSLQDSCPHVLFGAVLVKHLLDLISSFPQLVQFLRFDFGDAHCGRAFGSRVAGTNGFVIFKMS